MSRRKKHPLRQPLGKGAKLVQMYSDGLAHLSQFPNFREDLERAQADAVMEARRQGATWAEIGTALGMTSQGAHKRYNAMTDQPP